jgi:vancomycin permeability regulator SanA
MHIVKTFIAITLATAVVVVLGISAWVVNIGGKDVLYRSDAIIVLGAAQFDGRPSDVLQARLDRAFELWQLRTARKVITTGSNQPGDRTTEAQTGRRYLLSKGMSRASVIAVAKGTNTLDSLRAVDHRLKDLDATRVTVVTDPAHMVRSLIIVRDMGYEAFGAPTRSGAGSKLSLSYVTRETAAVLRYLLLQRTGIIS